MSIIYLKKKIEPYLHAWSLSYPLATGSVCASMGWFNHSWDQCWISFPDCSYEECRFKQFMIQMICAGIGLVICLIIIVYSLVSIIIYYRQQEKMTRAYRRAGVRMQRSHRRDSTISRNKIETSKQAALYIGAFLITYMSSYVTEILAALDAPRPEFLFIITSITLPLQGFMNFVIYARPNINRIRRNKPEATLMTSLRILFF
mmetsp:Transcript_36388/g.44471  ORF Transcript_36388/g.44471 Transcript_36388/m.44471 type:complete len:203 (+) Transcript_36388:1-609(+)